MIFENNMNDSDLNLLPLIENLKNSKDITNKYEFCDIKYFTDISLKINVGNLNYDTQESSLEDLR